MEDAPPPLGSDEESKRAKARNTSLRIVNSRTPEQWAERIKAGWQNNVKGIFDTGLELLNSREELGAGEFWTMVREELKYARSTVTQLMCIASDPRLLEVGVPTLPPSWYTLYSLTRLTDEQFDKGIEDGTIHAGMERKDIALLKPPKEKPVPPPPLKGRDLIEERSILVRKSIVSVLRELSEQEKGEFLALVRFQLDDIEGNRRQVA